MDHGGRGADKLIDRPPPDLESSPAAIAPTVDRAKAELESRGIEFKSDTLDSGVCYQAFFEDPDGNVLAIHHRYAPSDAGPGSSS